MNSNNRWFPWLIWGVVAVLAVLWCVWWIHFKPFPYTNPWRSLGRHGLTLLGGILVWLSAYYSENVKNPWLSWSYSVIIGCSIPDFIEELLHVNHMRILSPLGENALLIFGFLTAIGLGFLAQRRGSRAR